MISMKEVMVFYIFLQLSVLVNSDGNVSYFRLECTFLLNAARSILSSVEKQSAFIVSVNLPSNSYNFTLGLFLCLVRFFFDVGFLHFHISPVIPVCTFVPIQFRKLCHRHFGLSFQNLLEPLNIILCSHQSNFQHIFSPFPQEFPQWASGFGSIPGNGV